MKSSLIGCFFLFANFLSISLHYKTSYAPSPTGVLSLPQDHFYFYEQRYLQVISYRYMDHNNLLYTTSVHYLHPVLSIQNHEDLTVVVSCRGGFLQHERAEKALLLAR